MSEGDSLKNVNISPNMGNGNHICIGVYSSGDYKVNIVEDAHLESNVEYNRVFRPGRAYFVDGVCVQKGYLNDLAIDEWADKIKTFNIDSSRSTVPYQ